MEDMQLYTCYSPLIKEYYLAITVVSLLSWIYFLWRLEGDDFSSAILLLIISAPFGSGAVTFFVYIFDNFYFNDKSLVVAGLKSLSNISTCFDDQGDYSKYFYNAFYKGEAYASYPEHTNLVVIVSIMLFFGVSRIIYDFVRYTYVIPEAIGRIFKNISLRIVFAKEKRKLKVLRSEEAGKLNAVKLQLKRTLETEKKTVENTLLQLTAQQQRVAASRQKLMVKDMDQEI